MASNQASSTEDPSPLAAPSAGQQSLVGKVVWITGAGSGIGEACALAFGQAGAKVILTGRRAQALDTVAQRIHAQGGHAMVLAGDMTDREAVMAIAAAIDSSYKALHILINNAGLNVLERNWSVLTADRANDVIEANLSSAFYGVIAALPIMRRQGDGLLI
ncbi:MAG: SDR family NAD(P)-dependent oxidoreductase, partial [Betaproteobacteria bacterium]|nr:SDR family NAD(P)-dependent oxidoreductase [Betaproteobacteria bacterium]